MAKRTEPAARHKVRLPSVAAIRRACEQHRAGRYVCLYIFDAEGEPVRAGTWPADKAEAARLEKDIDASLMKLLERSVQEVKRRGRRLGHAR